MSHRNSLDEIACRLGTDKSSRSQLPPTADGYDARPVQGHGYTIFYEHYFSNRRSDPIRLLEIGVLAGKSLATWREYFPHALLYGVDIDPACARFEDERTRIFIGSQADPAFLEKVRREVPEGFDIVIDDGSHYVKHIIISFQNLFDAVKPGGMYVIEDIHVATWPDWGQTAHNRGMELQKEETGNDIGEMVDFLRSVRARKDVHELVLHLKKICFIEKKSVETDADEPRWQRGDLLESLIPPPAPEATLRRRIARRLLG